MEKGPAEKLSASLEDYLETILQLESETRVARAKDIAERMQVSRASVTGALKTLGERKLINYSPYSFVTLTKRGKSIAQEIIRRHNTLKEFFQDFLRMDEDHADSNACRVEHAMDSQAMDRLVSFLTFLKECPRTGVSWLDHFNQYCKGEMDPEKCDECFGQFLNSAQSERASAEE